MRKIKSYFFISLDGVVESPDKWHFPYFNDEMGAAVGSSFDTADAVLMGRVLYDEWAAVLAPERRPAVRRRDQRHPEVRRLQHAAGGGVEEHRAPQR